jgi:hypothetical protein
MKGKQRISIITALELTASLNLFVYVYLKVQEQKLYLNACEVQ